MNYKNSPRTILDLLSSTYSDACTTITEIRTFYAHCNSKILDDFWIGHRVWVRMFFVRTNNGLTLWRNISPVHKTLADLSEDYEGVFHHYYFVFCRHHTNENIPLTSPNNHFNIPLIIPLIENWCMLNQSVIRSGRIAKSDSN